MPKLQCDQTWKSGAQAQYDHQMIPLDSDPRRRRAGSPQPCSCRDANTAKFDDRQSQRDVDGENRGIPKFDNTEHQTNNDDKQMEEDKSDETPVAVIKSCCMGSMRIASLVGSGANGSAGRWSSPGRAANDMNEQVDELVRAFVGSIMKERDIVVTTNSKSKLRKDMSLKRVIFENGKRKVSTLRGVQGQCCEDQRD